MFVQRWDRSFNQWFPWVCALPAEVGLTLALAVLGHHVCQLDSWPLAGHALLEWVWDMSVTICSANWSKWERIDLFSCCTAETISASFKIMVFCKATIWELLWKCVWVLDQVWQKGNPWGLIQCFFCAHCHFTVDIESSMDFSSAWFFTCILGKGGLHFGFPVQAVLIVQGCCQHEVALVLDTFFFWTPEGIFSAMVCCHFEPFFMADNFGPGWLCACCHRRYGSIAAIMVWASNLADFSTMSTWHFLQKCLSIVWNNVNFLLVGCQRVIITLWRDSPKSLCVFALGAHSFKTWVLTQTWAGVMHRDIVPLLAGCNICWLYIRILRGARFLSKTGVKRGEFIGVFYMMVFRCRAVITCWESGWVCDGCLDIYSQCKVVMVHPIDGGWLHDFLWHFEYCVTICVLTKKYPDT